ncbi:hypothetical protein FPV16_25055 [Methylobacterium sp. W2]|uniref:hypothetical protein n=1 Tax=Methylobacterium sp. W2 TaxID=2598107 RepID=UPI001D0C609D|nr:hypothetical protein [Methylobacterium sp. W2]MCC0809427.1 hypothetical protein [Methylobacterium sp. W2]
MSTSFRNTDPTLTANDLAFQVEATARASRALMQAVAKLAFEGATGATFDNGNGQRAVERLRAAFEGAVEDTRTAFVDVLGGPGAANGSVASLVVALRNRLSENEMAASCRARNADPLVAAAHAHGAALAASLPPMTPDYQLGFTNCAGA